MMGNVSQFNHFGPNLHAVYHANPNQHNIVTEEDILSVLMMNYDELKLLLVILITLQLT